MLWSTPSTNDPGLLTLQQLWPTLYIPDEPPRITRWRDFDARRRPPKHDSPTDAGLPGLCTTCLRPVVWALNALEARNASIYPARSMMAWHTNSDCPGKRRYYTWSAEGGAVFRYLDPETNQVIDEVEPPGWVVREFTIPAPSEGYFWHAIYSPVTRYSFGFLMP